jgi:preprotein translocase subunit SecF
MEFFKAQKAFNFMGWVKPIFTFSFLVTIIAFYLIFKKDLYTGLILPAVR